MLNTLILTGINLQYFKTGSWLFSKNWLKTELALSLTIGVGLEKDISLSFEFSKEQKLNGETEQINLGRVCSKLKRN